MTWTKEPPTMAGWYWARKIGDNSPECVEVKPVVFSLGVHEAQWGQAWRANLSWKCCIVTEFEWWGPIEMPS